MFYLTTHLTYFIYGYMASDHSDARENMLPPHGLLFPINSMGYFICTIPHPWYTSCEALARTGNSSMGPLHEGLIRRPITPWENALTTELHLVPNSPKQFYTFRINHFPVAIFPQKNITQNIHSHLQYWSLQTKWSCENYKDNIQWAILQTYSKVAKKNMAFLNNGSMPGIISQFEGTSNGPLLTFPSSKSLRWNHPCCK